MRVISSFILAILMVILLTGCIEYEVEKISSTTTSTTSTSLQTSLPSTTVISTIITTSSSTTTTTLSKISYSCDDFCKKEGYEGGKCRKTAAQCRRYGINEVYKPLGNKYCPKGKGYDACCCLYPLPTTSSTTSSTTSLPAKKKKTIEGFVYLRPLIRSVEYKADGFFSSKILNTAGVKVKIINVSSKECQGVGLGSLDQLELKEGEETMIRAKCEKKKVGESYTLNLTFNYKELIPSGVEIYYQDSGLIKGYVK